jgi:hypothetical protein
VTDPVALPTPPVAPEGRHVERATFCPPPVSSEIVSAKAAVATASGAGVPIDFEDALTEPGGTPPAPQASEVRPGAFLMHNLNGAALNAIGFGDRPIAGAIQSWPSPARGAGAALCSESPSDTWYFPVGSSEIGTNERLLLYNPFPGDAVASVRFFAPTGPQEITGGLDEVAVPSRGWTEVAVNNFVKAGQKLISARVHAERGRLIAWRVLFTKVEGRAPGVGFTLGAPEGSDTWYFPHGMLGDDVEQRLTLFNPTDEEAHATVTIVSGDVDFVPTDDLTEIQLEPGTSQQISLSKVRIKEGVDLAHSSVIVAAERGVPIIVERTLYVDDPSLEGVATEIGTAKPGTRWLLPPLGRHVSGDSVAVLNTGQSQARIEVRLFTLQGTEAPEALAGLELSPGRRLEKSLDDYSANEPFFVVVTSDQPVTVERLGYSSSEEDLVDVMGRHVAEVED